MWSVVSHKSSSIFSVVIAERDEPLPSPPPSHSHVYLPVIHALEQRLLMPCLWYMTHHVPQRFIQWINPERGGEKKQPKREPWLLSLPRLAHNSLFLCSSPLILLAGSVTVCLDQRWSVIWPLQGSALYYLRRVISDATHRALWPQESCFIIRKISNLISTSNFFLSIFTVFHSLQYNTTWYKKYYLD